MQFSLLIVAFAFLPLFYVIHLVYSSFTSPLRSVPGPFLARFTKLWYFWHVSQGHFEQVNLDLHRKYGPIVRYGPNEYSINDPDAAKTIYGHGTHFTKSSWYSGWGVPGGRPTLFTDQDPHHHAQERRKYQTTYSMSALVTYEAYVDDCARIFRQRLDEMSKAATTVDMGHWFQCYAFDVIGAITFSRRFGILDSGTDVGGVMKALDENMVYSTLIGIYSSLNTYFFPLMNRFRLGGAAGKAYLSAFINQTITKRTAERTASAEKEAKIVDKSSDIIVPQDFLSKFLTFHSEDPTKFTNWNVQVGMIANIFAGSDTTSTTLSGILYHLLKEPQTFAKLRDEIESFHRDGRISSPVTFKESQTMPYLQAVIREAQRVHPAVGLPLERVVPKGGATLCGRFFPQGTVVGINCWVAHHNSSVFGANGFDVNKYRPERWLVDDKDRLSAMDKYYMPFGMGSRTCIGKHISFLEMSKLIPELVRHFDFSLGDELAGPDAKWTLNNTWFVRPVDFRVKIAHRPE